MATRRVDRDEELERARLEPFDVVERQGSRSGDCAAVDRQFGHLALAEPRTAARGQGVHGRDLSYPPLVCEPPGHEPLAGPQVEGLLAAEDLVLTRRQRLDVLIDLSSSHDTTEALGCHRVSESHPVRCDVTGQHGAVVSLAELNPALELRLVAGPVELRGMNDDDLVELCELALGGIHPPDQMPFYVPWTDAPKEQLARNTAQYHWRARAALSPDSWELLLGVWYEGVLVGTQGLSAHNFAVTRTGETGSWLGRAFQGQGIGTAMRRAACALAFDHLDAVEVTSGAFLDNPASLSVSRKVGYRLNGIVRVQRREGELALKQNLVLTPDTFDRGDTVVIVDGVDAFRSAIGLGP